MSANADNIVNCSLWVFLVVVHRLDQPDRSSILGKFFRSLQNVRHLQPPFP